MSTYIWRRLDLDGRNFVRLDEGNEGVSVHGDEICAEGDARWAARFEVTLDPGWLHRRTTVEVVDGNSTRRLELASREGGAWARDGGVDDTLADCTVVDLAGNPFTNAFVTRRIPSGVGDDVEVRAVYIETPALTVRPLVQRYRRLASDQWIYADDEFGEVRFTTDAHGIVLSYEGLAERL